MQNVIDEFTDFLGTPSECGQTLILEGLCLMVEGSRRTLKTIGRCSDIYVSDATRSCTVKPCDNTKSIVGRSCVRVLTDWTKLKQPVALRKSHEMLLRQQT